ncbi:MAG: hypothetical protein WD556_11940 [Actinomycetota bacterium]
MSTCSVCGAALSPQLAWCGQCFSPVANMRPDRSYRRTSERPGDPVITLPATTTMPERTAGDLVIVPPTPTVGFRPTAGPRPQVEPQSASLGVVGKLVVTAIVLGTGAAITLGLEGFRDQLGDLAGAIELVVLGAYTILAAIVLWFTWRTSPHSRVAERSGSIATYRSAMPRPDVVRIDEAPVDRDAGRR